MISDCAATLRRIADAASLPFFIADAASLPFFIADAASLPFFIADAASLPFFIADAASLPSFIADRWLRHLGLVLVLTGFFGPWVGHKTAALTATGFGLSEFAKFFPGVQDGTVTVIRALFLTPLIAAAVSIGLLGNEPDKHPLVRFVVTALAALLALFALPPVGFILASEYRLQLILTVGGLLLVLLTLLSRRLPRRIRGILTTLLALAGAAPALWQFVLLRPLVVNLYDAPVGLGWGLILCTAGLALLLLSGISAASRPN